MNQNTRRTERSARSQRSRPYNTYVRREDFARIPGVFDEQEHILRSPKNSLIARAFSVFGTLLALIFLLNVLRFKNTLYYFGNQPLIFNGEGETLVRWQFTVSVALYSGITVVQTLGGEGSLWFSIGTKSRIVRRVVGFQIENIN